MLSNDPKTSALYLNEALLDGEVVKVAHALQALRRREQCKISSLRGGPEMCLAEVFDILESAGVRLVALPAKPAT